MVDFNNLCFCQFILILFPIVCCLFCLWGLRKTNRVKLIHKYITKPKITPQKFETIKRFFVLISQFFFYITTICKLIKIYLHMYKENIILWFSTGLHNLLHRPRSTTFHHAPLQSTNIHPPQYISPRPIKLTIN